MKNNSYTIITDSCSDLTEEIIEKTGITVYPMEYKINDKSYHNFADYHEQSSKEFYDLMRAKHTATTFQINPFNFVEFLKPILDKGQDILLLIFSSALSGTYNSAVMALEELRPLYPERKMIVIDTLAASMGSALLATYASVKQNEGLSLEDNATFCLQIRDHIAHFFTVDDLGTLKRGGRLSATMAFLGTALQLKPVLHVSLEGKLVPISKSRGRKASLLALIEKTKATITEDGRKLVYISHGDDEESAHFVGDKLLADHVCEVIYYGPIGPVIGAHSGPNTIAVFFLASEK